MSGTPLPPWQKADLPAPPPFGVRGFLTVVGPSAILLATSIGSGEWLLGPAAAVKYGTGILAIVTVSVVLQVVFNVEALRYTISTGEPIITGFMRLGQRPRLWGSVYAVFGLLQLGWPAFAAASGAALFAAVSGRLPRADDAGAVLAYGAATFLLSIVILASGRRIERTLERVSWALMLFVFLFLMATNVLIVPSALWGRTLAGFAFLGTIPTDVDWALVGGFAAYAGAGGVINLMITSWARDRGFGMGAAVGFISGAAADAPVPLSPGGRMFATTPDNLERWRTWMRYVAIEQWGVWGLGCLVGMFLTVNLAIAIMPSGTDLTGLAAGAYQAEYLAGHTIRWMWLLTLLNGFWILFSTQLVTTDALVRLVTDLLWTASPKVRRFARHDVRWLYYSLLFGFALWGGAALTLAPPVTLVLIGANIAGFVLMFAAMHIVLVNRRLLPVSLRPSRWREAAMLGVSLFFAVFVIMNLLGR